MEVIQKLKENFYYVGKSDRRLALFENSIPLSNGVSYNSYLYTGSKNILVDTADIDVLTGYLENVKAVLNGGQIDYIIVQHMEPDHSSSLQVLATCYPEAKIICTMMAKKMIGQFCSTDFSKRIIVVKDKESMQLGDQEFTFYTAPNVHWPEVMMTYNSNNCILFTADAFGSFDSLVGDVTDKNITISQAMLTEYRRYYTNIVGKYGKNVQNIFNKISDLRVKMVCPLHSRVLVDNIEYMVEKYNYWSTYTPEDDTILMVYGSVYGNTANVCDVVASKLAESGVSNIVMYDVSKTHVSDLLAEAFRCNKLVLASVTLNSDLFPPMKYFIDLLIDHNYQNREIYLIENGSWNTSSGKVMEEMCSKLKNVTVSSNRISIKSSLKDSDYEQVNTFVADILKD